MGRHVRGQTLWQAIRPAAASRPCPAVAYRRRCRPHCPRRPCLRCQAGNAEDVEKYSKRTVRVTREHNEECRTLLRLMGVPVLEAPGEAEAQCSQLCKDNLVRGAERSGWGGAWSGWGVGRGVAGGAPGVRAAGVPCVFGAHIGTPLHPLTPSLTPPAHHSLNHTHHTHAPPTLHPPHPTPTGVRHLHRGHGLADLWVPTPHPPPHGPLHPEHARSGVQLRQGVRGRRLCLCVCGGGGGLRSQQAGAGA